LKCEQCNNEKDFFIEETTLAIGRLIPLFGILVEETKFISVFCKNCGSQISLTDQDKESIIKQNQKKQKEQKTEVKILQF